MNKNKDYMQNNDNTRKLYDALVADNYELGDYEKFTSDISNPEYMRKLYDTMVADDYELGEYNTFSSRYSVTPQGKAAQATQATVQAAQPVVDAYGMPMQPEVSTVEDAPKVEEKPQENLKSDLFKPQSTETPSLLNVGAKPKDYLAEAGAKAMDDIRQERQAREYQEIMKPYTSSFGRKKEHEYINTSEGYVAATKIFGGEEANRRRDELNEQARPWMEAQKSWTPSSARRFREQTMEQTWYDPYAVVPEEYKALATQQWGKEGSEDAYFSAWMNLSPEEREAFVKREHIKTFFNEETSNRMQGIRERALEEKGRGIAKNAMSPMGYNNSAEAAMDRMVQDAGNVGTQTLKALDKAEEIKQAYKSHQLDENFFAGAYKGMKDGLTDIDNWTGLYMVGEMTNLYDIAEKMEKGEELTQTEEDFLDAQAYKLAVEAALADDLGWGYGSGNVTGASVPFMLQMLASPLSGASGKAIDKGFAAVGRRAIDKFGKGILKKLLTKAPVKKVAKGLVGTVGKGIGQTILFGSDRVAAGTMERHLGNEMVAERANEEFNAGVQAKAGEDLGTALFKAGVSASMENISEFAGGAFIDDFTKMVGKKISKEFMDAMGGSVGRRMANAAARQNANKVFRAIANNKWGQHAVNLSKSVQNGMEWDGLLNEYLEEVLNNASNVMIGDMSMEDFTSLEKNAETLLGLAWTSGFFTASNAASRVGGYARGNIALKRTDRAARQIFTGDMQEKWEAYTQALSQADGYEEVEQLYKGLVAKISKNQDKELAGEQMSAAAAYMTNYVKMMGMNAATEEADEEEQKTPAQKDIETAQGEGIAAQGTEEEMDVVEEMDESYNQLAGHLEGANVEEWLLQYGESAAKQLEAIRGSELDEQTKAMAEAYLTSAQRYEGLLLANQEEVDAIVDEAAKEFDANVNQELGSVIQVLTTQGKTAYVIQGNPNERENIRLRYEDGTTEPVSHAAIDKVLSQADANTMRSDMIEGVRKSAVAEVVKRMQGAVPNATQMQMPVGHNVVVDGQAGVVAGVNADGTMQIQMQGGNAVNAAPQQVMDAQAYNTIMERKARARESARVSVPVREEVAAPVAEEATAEAIAAEEELTEAQKLLQEYMDESVSLEDRQAIVGNNVAQAKQAAMEAQAEVDSMTESKPKATDYTSIAEFKQAQEQWKAQMQEKQQALDLARQQEATWSEVQKGMIQPVETATEQTSAEAVPATPQVTEVQRAEAKNHNSKHDIKALAKEVGVSAKRIQRVIDFANQVGVKMNFANVTRTQGGKGAFTNADNMAKDRTITLSKYQLAKGMAIEWVMGHELTHQIKADGNAANWGAYKQAIINALGQDAFDKRVKEQSKVYREAGAYQDMSANEFVETMQEEVCADAAGDMLLNPDNMNKVMGVPQSLASRIWSSLKNMVTLGLPTKTTQAVAAWQQLAEGKELTGEADGRERHSIVGTTGARALDKAEGTTVRMDNMDVAEEMEAAGKDAETIWMATGWERGADGKWKYEVLEDFAYEEPRAKAERLQDEYQQVQNEKENIYRYLNMLPARGLTEQQKAIKKEQNTRLKKLIRQGEQLQDEIIESNFDTTLGELIGTDNNIIKAYPELASMPVSFMANSRFMDAGLKGAFDGEGIWINPTLENTAPTLLHEVQHAIQRIEGFARGGNTGSVKTKADALREDVRPLHEMMLDTPEWAERQRLQNRWFDETDAAEIAKIEQRVNEINESGVLDAIQSKRKQLQEKYGMDATVSKILGSPYAEDAEIWQQLPESFNDKYEAYRSLAGEAEARNVSARLNMSEEERRQTRPGKTEDVAREEQTVKMFSLVDYQGNPLNDDGTLKVEEIHDIDDLTEEDFYNAYRNVMLPPLPQEVNDAINAQGKRVVIKKNIFGKNLGSHKDLTAQDGRNILRQALYSPMLYGQNQKIKRPNNWILIHVAETNSAVVVEVAENKDAVEIINWHFLRGNSLEQKKRQAIKEGGLILTLNRAAGNTLNSLSSASKDTQSVSTEQTDKKEISEKSAESNVEVTNEKVASLPKNEGEQALFSISAEEQGIIDAAKANGTYMKAPNGKPTNLNEKQWAQVRTKAFKEWFGDWEKALRIAKLRGSTPIVVEFNGEYELNRDSAKQWMKDNLRGEYTNADTGEKIQISKVGINEVTAHGSKDEAHLKSLSAIPSMIEGAVFIEELTNSKEHDKYDSYRYYVCGLVIDGVDYTAKIVIGVKDGSRYYDHRLTEIEKGTLLDNLNGLSNSVAEMQNTSSSVGKDTKLISILQANASKIVDENGEPMVVYHGGTFGIKEYVPNGAMHFGSKVAAMERVLDTEWGKDNYEIQETSPGEYSWEYADPDDADYDRSSGRTFASYENALKDAVDSIDGVGIGQYYINAKNPMRVEDKDNAWEDAISIAQKAGADAIVYENQFEDIGSDSYIAFSSSQIKSATDNVGTFDAENADIRYSMPADILAANERFNEELDALTQENADRMIFDLGTPSAYLKSAGVHSKPMKLYGSKIIKKQKKHGFKLEELRNLPIAIANPIAVFDNHDEEGNRAILTELNTDAGNILVAISLGKGADIDFNIISSAFGKDTNKIVNWINKGFGKYYNKEKALEYLHLAAPIAAASDNQELSDATKIVQDFQNPPILEDESSQNVANAKSGEQKYSLPARPAIPKRNEGEGIMEYAQRVANATEAQKAWDVANKTATDIDRQIKNSEEYRDILAQKEPQTIEEAASMALAGTKLLWDDYTDGSKVLKGVKSMMGWKEGEREKMFTMFASRKNGGVSLERVAEAVMQVCDEYNIPYDETDAMAGMTAVMEVLGSAEKPSDITGYIEHNRIEQVRRMIEEEQEMLSGERNRAYMDMYGMTYDDFVEIASTIDAEDEQERSDDKNVIAWLYGQSQRQQERITNAQAELEQLKRNGVPKAQYDAAYRALEQMKAKAKQIQAKLDEVTRELSAAKGQATRQRKANMRYKEKKGQWKQVFQKLREAINGKNIRSIDKNTLNEIMRAVGSADLSGMARLFGEAGMVEDIILGVNMRATQDRIDKLLATKTTALNDKGIATGKSVDASVQAILANVRKTLEGILHHDIENQIHDLRSQNWHIRHNALGNLSQEQQEQIDANKAKIEELKAELDRELATNTASTEQAVNEQIEKLTEQIDKGIRTEEESAELMTTLALKRQMVAIHSSYQDTATVEALLRRKQSELRTSWVALHDGNTPQDKREEYRQKRKALQEQIAGLEAQVREGRQATLDAMQSFADSLEETITTGRANLKGKMQEQLQRRKEFVAKAIHDVNASGKQMQSVNEADKQENDKLPWYKRMFSPALRTFDYMLQKVATRTYGKDSWLYRQFMLGENGVMAAHDEYLRGMQTAARTLEDKAKEIFGKSYQDVMAESNRKKDIGIEILRDAEDYEPSYIPLKLTKGQATYIYMLWRMRDGFSKLATQGFTEEIMQRIEEYIGPDYIQWADWMQMEYLPMMREKYNARYREIYDTNMAAIDNYVPIRIHGQAIRKEVDLTDATASMPGMQKKNGALIQRTVNVNPIDISNNIFELIGQHIDEMEEFYAYAPVRRDLQYILSSPAFRNLLNTQEPGTFQSLLEAARIATKTNQQPESAALKAFNDVMNKTQKGLVSGNIAYRNMTAIKQVLSAPAFIGYSQSPVYLSILAGNMLGGYLRNIPVTMFPLIPGIGHWAQKMTVEETAKGMPYIDLFLGETFRWCMREFPDFRERVTRGSAGDIRLEEKGFSKLLDKYTAIGMSANVFIDAVTVSVGLKSIYDYEMKKAEKRIQKMAKEMQMDKQWAEEELRKASNAAKIQATLFANQTQQSSNPALLSPMQVSKNFMERSLTLYKNSSLGLMRAGIGGMRNLLRYMKGKKARRRMTEEYTRMFMQEGFAENEAKKRAISYLNSEARKGAFVALLEGYVMNVIWNLGSKGLLGFMAGGGDDDKERTIGEWVWDGIKHVAKNTFGSAMPFVNDALEGRLPAIGLTTSEAEKAWKDIKKQLDENGISLAFALTGMRYAAKFGGVDMQVWANTMDGYYRLFSETGNSDENTLALMLILNSPHSNRMAVARELYKGKSEEEFQKAIELAGRYSQPVWAFGREKTDKVESDMVKWYLSDNATDEERQRMRYKEDIDEQIDNLETVEDALELFDKVSDTELRKKISSKIDQISKPEETFAEKVDRRKENALAEDDTDMDGYTYMKMSDSQDLLEEKRMRAEIDMLRPIVERQKDLFEEYGSNSAVYARFMAEHGAEIRRHNTLKAYSRAIQARKRKMDEEGSDVQTLYEEIKELYNDAQNI